LSFEAIDQRGIPFSLPLFGDLPQGQSLAGPPEITPEVASVFGPASRIVGLDSIPLRPLDLSTVDSSGPVTVPVDSSAFPGLSVQPLEVSVVIPMERTATREFPDLRVSLPELDADPQLQSRPSNVSVVLLGPRSLVEGFNAEALTVSIPTNRATLAPGQEEDVVVVVRGVPPFVEFRVTPYWVTVRRPAGSAPR
jgi:YbbR domain-containing protein